MNTKVDHYFWNNIFCHYKYPSLKLFQVNPNNSEAKATLRRRLAHSRIAMITLIVDMAIYLPSECFELINRGI